MRKIIYLFILSTIVLSCSADSESANFAVGDNTGQGGSLARFIIVGDYLYTVDEQSINVFDISDVQNVVKVNDVYVGFGIETIYSFENTLFLGSSLGMYIYGLDDPALPELLSNATHLRSCDPVVSNFNYTFVTLHSTATCDGLLNQLEVYDTTDLLNPILLNTIQFDRPIGMGIYNNFLIMSDLNTIRFLDITDPRFPQEIHTIAVDSYDVIVRGNELFVIGENTVHQYELDATDITATTELSVLNY